MAREPLPSAVTGPMRRSVLFPSRSRKHERCKVEFDEADANLPEWEIRRRWPRFDGECPDCGKRMIVYASATHYIAGDW